MQARPGEQRVTFGDYAFDLHSAILFKGGNWIRVPDQSLKVLAALLENPGETVTREELSRRLWPDGTHVEFEQGLNSVVKRLRAVLLDSSTAPRYIETLPKRGYRFIFPVQQTPPSPDNSEPPFRNSIAEQPATSLPRGSGFLQANASPRVAMLLAFLFVSGCAALLYQRAHRRSWALDQAIPKARFLAAQGEYGSAYDLASAAALRLPTDDPELERLWPIVSRSAPIASDPSGVTVFWKPYADLKSPWRLLGKTPLRDVRVCAGAV
ncbi:MAG: winged helix-turn-helix domain-containing protein, partial [Acidobacteriota bacterium]|nr:winged helix-turn-helix domain-containing protein [Acidobacteriota bacterium]